MSELKDFFAKLESIKQKKTKLVAEQSVLVAEKAQLLKELPEGVPLDDLDNFTLQLEKEIQKGIEELDIPEEYIDELEDIERNL